MKKQLGQFYTKRAEYIVENLLKIYPIGSIIIDPFAGENDLLNLVSNKHKIIGYDIQPKKYNIIKNDSLLNPISYNNKWIITNPPYLARNKNKDKIIYDKYQVNDLYKASMKAINGCNGGIVIVPLNFLCNKDNDFRKWFLSQNEIKRINIFEEQVFDDTAYTVCSFSFIKKENTSQFINVVFYPSGQKERFFIDYKNGYKIGSDFYNLIENKSNIKVSRLLLNETSNSNIFLKAIDTGSKNGIIKLEINKNYYYGKQTDRAFATIKFSKKISIKNQALICKSFNNILNKYRKKYHSLFLTNYRNSTKHLARKRISFNTAYSLVGHILKILDIK